MGKGFYLHCMRALRIKILCYTCALHFCIHAAKMVQASPCCCYQVLLETYSDASNTMHQALQI